MAFTPKTAPFSGSIHAVTVGTGDKAITIGGHRAMPFYTFDAPTVHAPKIGVEVSDLADRWDAPGLSAFYEGCGSFARRVERAASLEGADFVCLHFEGADPNGENRCVESCTADAVAAAGATDLPLAVMGCGNLNRDAELFAAVAEALQGRNLLFLSAKNENYKSVGASAALAYGHTVCAETADDINLAKQLNILLRGMTIAPEKIVMNIGTAAVGYGYDYVASTLDRIRLAALAQGDEDLQMPIVAPVSTDTWTVKESTATEEDEPAWGDREERAISMEIATAAADLTGGADAVILRHPAAVAEIRGFIASLI